MNLKETLKRDLNLNRYRFKHLADEADISLSHLSRVISGDNRSSYKIAQRLATAATKLTGKTYTPVQFLEIKP